MAVKRKSRSSRKPRRSSRSGRRPTRLDLLLDRVKPGDHEVTIDADGYTPEQVDRIYAAAKARGLHASGTRRWILIRDLRDQAEARARTSHGDMSAAANRSPLVS